MAALPQRKRPPPLPPKLRTKAPEKTSPSVTVRSISPKPRSHFTAEEEYDPHRQSQSVFAKRSPTSPTSINSSVRVQSVSAKHNDSIPNATPERDCVYYDLLGDEEPETIGESHSSDVYIGVVGVTGSGKSTLIQRLTGDKNILAYDSLHSGTREVQYASLQLGESKIHLVDTPGFNDSDMEDEDVYYLLTDWIKTTHEQGRKFSGLLYLHPMNRTREKGSDVRSLKIFKRLVGTSNYDRVVIGMTFLDLEEAAVVAAREAQLRADPGFWGDLIKAGARVIRIEADKVTDCKAVLADLAGQPAVTLQIEDELCNQGKTAAEAEAMGEMPHADELKLLKLQEQWEDKAQQMVYEERARLMAAFATEREELENLIFREQQAKQQCEAEVVLWKSHCEKEQEDYKRLKLQHQRAEETWQSETAQRNREAETRTLKEKLDAEKKEQKKASDQRYAERQIRKRIAYAKAQMKVLEKCCEAGKPKQQCAMLSSNLGKDIALPGLCDMCERMIKLKEPFCSKRNACPLGRSSNSSLTFLEALKETKEDVNEDDRIRIDVCTTCFPSAEELFPSSKWALNWQFAYMLEEMSCGLEDGTQRKCTSCSEPCLGFFNHCCACDCRVNLCPKCCFVRGKTCPKPNDHTLRLSFQWDPKSLHSVYQTS